MYMVTTSFMKILKFYEILWKPKFLKFFENFEILWNVFRVNKILIDYVFGNSKFVVPSTLTIDLGFASVNSQCLRDNKLAIPSYYASFASILHYKSEYCLMDIVMLFPQSFIRVWFFWESRLQHKCTWWLQVLWKFWNYWINYGNCYAWSSGVIVAMEKLRFFFSKFQNFQKISKISVFIKFQKFSKKKFKIIK
jgi:hypothetical protein